MDYPIEVTPIIATTDVSSLECSQLLTMSNTDHLIENGGIKDFMAECEKADFHKMEQQFDLEREVRNRCLPPKMRHKNMDSESYAKPQTCVEEPVVASVINTEQSVEQPETKRKRRHTIDGSGDRESADCEEETESREEKNAEQAEAKRRRQYNPLPCEVKENPVYQDYRKRNAEAVARCREKKKMEETQRIQEMEALRKKTRDQEQEILKLKGHTRALEHQVNVYREQITLLTKSLAPKMVLPVGYETKQPMTERNIHREKEERERQNIEHDS